MIVGTFKATNWRKEANRVEIYAQFITGVLHPTARAFKTLTGSDVQSDADQPKPHVNSCYQIEENRWQIGNGNDWWMRFDPATDEITLSYRYVSASNEEAFKGMIKYLEWMLSK
jgi:hypothetical protein